MSIAGTKTPPPEKPPVHTTPEIAIDQSFNSERFVAPDDISTSTQPPVEAGDFYFAIDVESDEVISSADTISGLNVPAGVRYDIEERAIES